jgi:hypothetical protein
MSRRVFNKLHEELSLAAGSLVPRWPLYQEIQSSGFDPEDMSPEEASVWCGDNGHSKVARKMRRYNPDLETPEEVMERLTS